MGKILLLKLRDAVVKSLGGFSGSEMLDVVRRANEIGDLAMKEKYNGLLPAIQVGVKVRQFRKLSALIFPEWAEHQGYVYVRRKSGVRTVEVIHRERERGARASVNQAPHETRKGRLLEQNT